MTDRLDDALTAYRRRGRDAGADPTATRKRLLQSVARAETRRRLLWASGIVLTLALTNSTTWALSTGRMDRWLAARSGSGDASALASPPTPAAEVSVAAPPALDESASSAVVQPSVDPAPTARIAATPVHASRPATIVLDEPPALTLDEDLAGIEPPLPAPPPPIAPTAEPSPSDVAAAAELDTADREAFAVAHRRHFDAATSVQDALGAWNLYLARFPQGRFVPEAVFNRAICLARLGRRDEARRDLARIARGDLGTTRQADAQRLLEALDAASDPRSP